MAKIPKISVTMDEETQKRIAHWTIDKKGSMKKQSELIVEALKEKMAKDGY
jgi:hypothetical protein